MVLLLLEPFRVFGMAPAFCYCIRSKSKSLLEFGFWAISG